MLKRKRDHPSQHRREIVWKDGEQESRTKAIMTDAQVGGRKGQAIVDHLHVLKETVNEERKQKKPVTQHSSMSPRHTTKHG